MSKKKMNSISSHAVFRSTLHCVALALSLSACVAGVEGGAQLPPRLATQTEEVPDKLPEHLPELPKHTKDSLYVADTLDDSVKRFDAKTGAFEGVFVSESSGGLLGPRGLIFGRHNSLLVVNQNVGTDFSGEVLGYDGKTGAFEKAVVPHDDDKAPYAPRGIVQQAGLLYVADMGEPGYVLEGCAPPNPWPARVAVYDERSGAWLRDIAYQGFQQTCSDTECVQWTHSVSSGRRVGSSLVQTARSTCR